MLICIDLLCKVDGIASIGLIICKCVASLILKGLIIGELSTSRSATSLLEMCDYEIQTQQQMFLKLISNSITLMAIYIGKKVGTKWKQFLAVHAFVQLLWLSVQEYCTSR